MKNLRNRTLFGIMLSAVLAFAVGNLAQACPFCTSVQQTIRQECLTMDAVVIASSLDTQATVNTATGVVKMKIEVIIKGDDLLKVGQTVNVVYYGRELHVGKRFLLSGVDPPNLQWTCLPVSERVEKYIIQGSKIEDDPVARLRYYRHYLEDEEEMISRDAYDEFASTPYEDIKKLKPEMDHDRLVRWVQQPEIGANRKRLYFTMLGVCGSKDDLPLLERLLRHPSKNGTTGFDALIACYLTLAGESGLPLINELFIANEKTPYNQSYSAIVAIRFHGTEGNVIPRAALVESFHKVLDRIEFADMVIPDLAKWNDWSQVERLKTLFTQADEDKMWVRVPVINYMRACPLPEAKKAIEELKKIDPDSVRRAMMFFPDPAPQSDSDSENYSDGAALPINFHVKYASATIPSFQGRHLIQPSQRPMLVARMNPWNLVTVLITALATIILAMLWVLTGGSHEPTLQRVVLIHDPGNHPEHAI